MDPSGSGEGLEEPSEQCLPLPTSLRGRQRKKNSKYFDYETDDVVISENPTQELSNKRLENEGAVPRKCPAKGRKPKTAEGGEQSAVQTSPDSVGETVSVPSKKRGRPKKTQSAVTPKETVTPDGDPPTGEAADSVADNSVQQENGTPKPKRKYVKKKAVQVVEDPPGEKDQEELPNKPEEENESGGRRRRGAAKVALKYLHLLAKEVLSHPSDEPGFKPSANKEDNILEQNSFKRRKGRKRKCLDSEAAEDEDFVPNIEEEADEVEDESEGNEVSDTDSEIVALGKSCSSSHSYKPYASSASKLDFIGTVWDAAKTTKKFRKEHHSSWVFPEWVPSIKDWDLVEESDLETFLPKELQSAVFKVTREGLTKGEPPQLRLSRFESTPAHSDRWDMFLFAGGPVWASEWCPTPDAALTTQYIALACHQGMDDLHHVNQTYTGPGLIQLWDCGKLEYNSRPESQPALVYGLAQDKGFIWQLKWCPAGGWEPPSCDRKAPFLPRLGLLAVATSSSVVTIYSLPHPDALLSNRRLPDSGKDSEKPPIYKARGVITLRLGSIKAPREEQSGQVLSMDWLPQKPHNIMVIGFYDGVVGLWNLSTKSALLRVRESDRSLTLLPYRCLLAHDHAVRALAFCPASRYLLTTAGEDRLVKLWDLRRLFDPIKVQKRYLTNEICWPLDAPGILKAEDSAIVPRVSMGIHFIDHSMNSYFAIPRNTSVWSISYSDWLHSTISADQLGEVILSMLPPLSYGTPPIKRSILRRFPAYFTSKVACDAAEDEEVRGGEEEGEAEKTQAVSEGGDKKENEGEKLPHVHIQTYKEAVKKYYLHYSDFNMRNLARMENQALWKRMQSSEGTTNIEMDDMPLTALYKVRFNPNMSSHVWVVSGGQTGLVRLHCLRTMINPHVQKMINKNQGQFSALYSTQEQMEAVQTEAEHL